jgi:hypothetical protein
MPAPRSLHPDTARRLGASFEATAAMDPRLVDLIDTMDAAAITASRHYPVAATGYGLATGTFMAGFVVAARLSEEDAASLHDLLHMLRRSPISDAIRQVDHETMTAGLRRDRA